MKLFRQPRLSSSVRERRSYYAARTVASGANRMTDRLAYIDRRLSVLIWMMTGQLALSIASLWMAFGRLPDH